MSNLTNTERFQAPVYDLSSEEPEPKLRLLGDVEEAFASIECEILWGPDFETAPRLVNGSYWHTFVRQKWPKIRTIQELLFHVTVYSRFSLRTPTEFYHNVVQTKDLLKVLGNPQLAEILGTPIEYLKNKRTSPANGLRASSAVETTEDQSESTPASKSIVDSLIDPTVDYAMLQDALNRRTQIRSNALLVIVLMRDAEKASEGGLRFFEEPMRDLIPESVLSIQTLPGRFECLAEILEDKIMTPALLLSRVAERPWSSNATLGEHPLTPSYVAGLLQANPGLVSDEWEDGLAYLAPTQLYCDFETVKMSSDVGLVSELISRNLSSQLRERLLEHLLQPN